MREMMLAAEAVGRKDSDHLDWWQILGWDSLDDWKPFHRHVADPTWAGIRDWKARRLIPSPPLLSGGQESRLSLSSKEQPATGSFVWPMGSGSLAVFPA